MRMRYNSLCPEHLRYIVNKQIMHPVLQKGDLSAPHGIVSQQSNCHPDGPVIPKQAAIPTHHPYHES